MRIARFFGRIEELRRLAGTQFSHRVIAQNPQESFVAVQQPPFRRSAKDAGQIVLEQETIALFRFNQGLLGAPAGGDVGEYAIRMADALLRVRPQGAIMDPNPLAVLTLDAILHIEGPIGREQLLERLAHTLGIVRVDVGKPEFFAFQDLLGRETDDFLRVGADVSRVAFDISGPDHIGEVRNQPAISLFALAEGLFRALAFGDVLDVGDKVLETALAVAYQGDFDARPNRIAVLLDIALLDFYGRTAIAQQVLGDLGGNRGVVRMAQLPPVPSEQFRAGIAQHVAKRWIHLQKAAIHTRQAHAEWRVLKGGAKAFFPVQQQSFGLFVLTDIPDDGGRADHFAGRSPDGADGERNFDFPARLGDAPGFEPADFAFRTDALHNGRQFPTPVWWGQIGDGFSDDLAGGVAVDGFGALVPTDDGPIERLTDDSFVERFHDGGEKSLHGYHRTAFGDVLFDRDIADNSAIRIADGSDGHLFGVDLAVFAAVDQFAFPYAAAANGLPQLPVICRILPLRLQHARIFAGDLVEAVAGHCGEGRIDI